MKITIRYTAQLRQAAGVAGEELDVEGPCSLPALLARVAGRREALRRLLLDGHGNLQPTILFFVGDNQVAPDDLILKDGDVLTLMAPIAGG